MKRYLKSTLEGDTLLGVPLVIIAGPFILIGALAALCFFYGRVALKAVISV
jgi:hypothetical protein